MSSIEFKDLPRYFNQNITVSGFVDSIRDLPYIQFIVLRNGNEKVQITIEKNEENIKLNEIVSNLSLEDTIKVNGILQENPHVKLRNMEIIPTNIELTSQCLDELPVNLREKEKTLRETRLDYRHLDLRRDEHYLIFQVQTTFEHAMREYWIKNDYIEIHSPKIIGTASESGADVFKLEYFDEEAFLAQSPQFYKQMAMASGFNKVFEIGPCFRAEKSHTSYHATEFTGIDTEIAWIDSHHDVMDAQEESLVYALKKVKEKHGQAIKELFNFELAIPTQKMPRLTFKETKLIISEQYDYKGPKDYDFDRTEEELIGDYALKKYNSEFIFITDYPKEARPFYHMLDENGNTKSYDLIYRGIEITTGAQREHRYEVLKQQALDKNLSLEPIDFYLNFFKYGCPPHGGYGFGLSRFLMQLFRVDNVREVTYLYRGTNRFIP